MGESDAYFGRVLRREELSGHLVGLADNHYILEGYRAPRSWKECVLSLFQLHNETINVWSHLVGAIVFIFLIVELAISLGFGQVRTQGAADFLSHDNAIAHLDLLFDTDVCPSFNPLLASEKQELQVNLHHAIVSGTNGRHRRVWFRILASSRGVLPHRDG